MSAIRPKSLLTVYDAADVLRVTPRRLGAMVRDGRIPYIRLPGGVLRFDPDDLLRFVEREKTVPAASRPPCDMEDTQR